MNAVLRFVFLLYFISHIPITILIDLQGNWKQFYPEILQDVTTWYCRQFKDFLMENPPAWFRSFIVCEACFQLPTFFLSIYGLLFKKNWIRIPLIVYGAHVSTTLVPILYEFAQAKGITVEEKLKLISIYSPYLIIPMTLCIYMSINDMPFKDSGKKNA